MKIVDARQKYIQNHAVLLEQMKTISKKKEEALKNYKKTGDSIFSEEAATLELSYEASQKAYEENQKVLNSMAEQWTIAFNEESTKQQAEAAEEYGKDLTKIMTVFRRLAHGDIVPFTDERKLMEFDNKMYQVAKNMQTMAQQLEKERKKYKSLWEEEEEKERVDPMEVANEEEYSGELPDIEIPSVETGEVSEKG